LATVTGTSARTGSGGNSLAESSVVKTLEATRARTFAAHAAESPPNCSIDHRSPNDFLVDAIARQISSANAVVSIPKGRPPASAPLVDASRSTSIFANARRAPTASSV